MSLSKKSLLLAAITFSTLTQAKLVEPSWYKNVFVTLNPGSKTVGPVMDPESPSYATYGDELTAMIKSQTHREGGRFTGLYGTGRNELEKYNAFMLMGYTIPLHEGLYTHFRRIKNEAGKCDKDRNNGLKLKDQGTTKKQFLSAFRNGDNPYLTDCSNTSSQSTLTQLIAGGGDSSDIGIMQLSSLWHYDIFLKEKRYESVQKSIRYGMNQLYLGFNQIGNNVNDFNCLKNTDGTLNLVKLMRASWGGWYNAGAKAKVDSKGRSLVDKVCRFSYFESDSETMKNSAGQELYRTAFLKAKTKAQCTEEDKCKRPMKVCFDNRLSNKRMTDPSLVAVKCAHAGKDKGFLSNLNSVVGSVGYKITNDDQIIYTGQTNKLGISFGKIGNTEYGFWPKVSPSSLSQIRESIEQLYKMPRNQKIIK